MQTAPRKVINAWAMYDWSNSVYNLVITTTFFPVYYTEMTKVEPFYGKVEFLGRSYVNTALYSYALAATYLLVAHWLLQINPGKNYWKPPTFSAAKMYFQKRMPITSNAS